MKEENAIEVSNVTKSFKVYKDKGHTLKEIALFIIRISSIQRIKKGQRNLAIILLF